MKKLNIIHQQKADLFNRKILELQSQYESFLKNVENVKIQPFKEIGKIEIPEYRLEVPKTLLETGIFNDYQTGNLSFNMIVNDTSRNYSVKEVPIMRGEEIIINGNITELTPCNKMFCTAEYLVRHIKKYNKFVNPETNLILGFQSNIKKEIHSFSLVITLGNIQIFVDTINTMHSNKRNLLLC